LSQPTNKELKAVHAVLYERKRLRQIFDDISSIDVLMHFNDPAQPDSAPLWYEPSTGQLTSSVLDAAQRCHNIAKALLQMRNELAGVKFDGGDKRHLREALKEQAASWSTRGDIWSTAGAPNEDAERVVAPITAHQVAGAQAAEHVTDYLKPNSDFNFGPS
jgi:hypothetical protein